MTEKLTRKDVANILKIPLRTVDYLVLTCQIPFSRIGKRSVRFDKNRLDEWFLEREGLPFHTGKGEESE